MSESAQEKLYATLCAVLDSLCREAPLSHRIYHPVSDDEQKVIHARSRALLHLFLKARFGLVNFVDREKLITDGPFDGGVDAFFIDRQQKKIHVLQSKFRANAANMEKSTVSADDLIKVDLQRILRGETKDELERLYNEKIRNSFQKEIRRISDVGMYEVEIALLGATRNLATAQIKRLVGNYPVVQYPHARLYEALMFPVVDGTFFADPKLTIEINLANLRAGNSHLDYNVKSHGIESNVKLLFVPTMEIGRIMKTYKNTILHFNPRSFLELRNNSVNLEIRDSLINSRGNDFALFNNGITILSDLTKISEDTGRRNKAQVVMLNPQLVNGGQTAYTLSRIYEDAIEKGDFSEFRGKEVLLRIITFVGKSQKAAGKDLLALIGDISRASNSQTKIEESDRRANDEIQVSLQNAFFRDCGLFYERKRGEFSDAVRAGYLRRDVIINRERLVRLSLAIEYRANLSRSNIAQFFKGEALAKVLVVGDVRKYAYAYQIWRLLRKIPASIRGANDDRYHTKRFGQGLRYGQYAIVAIATNLGFGRNIDEADALELALRQWKSFEVWVKARRLNTVYRIGRSFNFGNYYKGATINADLKAFRFKT